MKLSVVVCTYNRAELLRQCLEHLSLQTLDNQVFEVIVIDNNSSDATAEIVHEFSENYPHFRYILETQQGLAFARNRGFREAQAAWVAYLDDDALADPHWAEALLAGIQQSPNLLSVGGKLSPWFPEPPPAWFVPSFEMRSWGDTPRYLTSTEAAFGFSGGNMAFPKTVLEEFGGFNTALGMAGGKMGMGEETDLYHRIFIANRSRADSIFWYAPEAAGIHYTPKRNWQVSYRLRRSFSAGTARATMLAAEGRHTSWWRMMGYGFKQTLISLGKLIRFRHHPKTLAVQTLQAWAFVWGSLKS